MPSASDFTIVERGPSLTQPTVATAVAGGAWTCAITNGILTWSATVTPGVAIAGNWTLGFIQFLSGGTVDIIYRNPATGAGQRVRWAYGTTYCDCDAVASVPWYNVVAARATGIAMGVAQNVQLVDAPTTNFPFTLGGGLEFKEYSREQTFFSWLVALPTAAAVTAANMIVLRCTRWSRAFKARPSHSGHGVVLESIRSGFTVVRNDFPSIPARVFAPAIANGVANVVSALPVEPVRPAWH